MRLSRRRLLVVTGAAATTACSSDPVTPAPDAAVDAPAVDVPVADVPAKDVPAEDVPAEDVVDAAAPDRDAQVEAVERVLADIGAADLPRLTVLNKIDAAGLAPGVERDACGSIRTVRLSALDGSGCAGFIEALAERFAVQPARDVEPDGAAAAP